MACLGELMCDPLENISMDRKGQGAYNNLKMILLWSQSACAL